MKKFESEKECRQYLEWRVIVTKYGNMYNVIDKLPLDSPIFASSKKREAALYAHGYRRALLSEYRNKPELWKDWSDI